MIRVVPALDVDAFAPVEFPVVVVVLVAYGVATGSLDRLVVGGSGRPWATEKVAWGRRHTYRRGLPVIRSDSRDRRRSPVGRDRYQNR